MSQPYPFPSSVYRPTLRRSLLSAAVRGALATFVVAGGVLPSLASAQGGTVSVNAEAKAFDIPAGQLDIVLDRFARTAGINLSYDPALVSGLESRGIRGNYSVAAGLTVLLANSGLEAIPQSGGYVLKRASSGSKAVLPEVAVTASAEQLSEGLPQPYAGGQVARGSRLGMLGNRDYMDTPFSTTSYTAELIQNQQARTLADVVANDPSVRNFYSQSFPQDSFYIRGFQVDSSDIAMDGLYGVSTFMRTSPALYERVEVLKGPSALLNGTPPFGGVGGTVNLVSKRATDEPVTQVTGSFASKSQFGAHVDVGRRFGPNKSIGVRINALLRDGETALEDNHQRLGAAVIGLDYRSPDMRLSMDLGYQKQKERGLENSLFMDPGTALPRVPDASKRVFQPWLNLNNKDVFGSVRGEYDLSSDTTVFAAVGGSKSDLQELYAYGYPLAANGNFTEIVGRHTGYTETKTMQAGLRTRAMVGAVEHKLNFTVSTLTQERGNIFVFGLPNGVAPINSNIYDPVFVNDPSLGPLSGSIPKESDLKLTSFAFADTVSMLDDKLTLILGARVQRVKATNFDTATGDVTTSSDDQKTSPATGIVYKVSKSMSVYANYIEGFSPAPSYAANANRLLPPAVSKQVEAGTKFDFGNAGLAFSVFRIEQPNVIFDTGSGRYTQDGMQRNQGMEVSMFGEPIRNVRVLGGAMFLSGKLDKTEGGINDGNHALNVPKLNVNLGVEWDTPFIMPGLTWTARGIHTGKQWVDTANTAEIPAWSRFDIGARLMTRVGGRPVTLRATVENVADKSYWANSSLYRGAPRTFLLSGTINF